MSNEKMDLEKKKCVTPTFRVSFPHLFTPHKFDEKQEAKFMLTMLFDKKTDLSKNVSVVHGKTIGVAMRDAARNAAIEKWGTDQKSWPKNLRLPFRDGSEKSELQGYEGCIFVSATSKMKPGVVDQACRPITTEDDGFYAGCYARATLIAFAYDQMGNKGVSFSLQNVQKVRDGDPFSGRKAATDEFDSIETEENQSADTASCGSVDDIL